MSEPETSSTVADPSTVPQSQAEMEARFTEDVSPYLRVLAGAARRYAHNPRDAEDLVQETLIKAYVSFHSFRGGSNLLAWLCQIMRRTWIDAYRATQRRPCEVLAGLGALPDEIRLGGVQRLAHVSPSAETEMFDVSLGEELRQALWGLAEPLRIVIYYADIEGRTSSDIAAVLNIPRGTVMSRIYRARQRLRAQLARTDEAVE